MSKVRTNKNRKMKKDATNKKKLATKRTKENVIDPFEEIERALDSYATNNNYFSLTDGGKARIHIDVIRGEKDETKNNPRVVETDSFDKKTKVLRVRILLTDARDGKVKVFMCAKRDFAALVPLLRKDHADFEITRNGSGLDTRYTFIPI
jgi:hypothetical protein